jgi:GNAT superfamily N-acetyltransferase
MSLFKYEQLDSREVGPTDEALLIDAASLVSRYSWGEDYPVRPIDEIRSAEYRIGVFESDRLVGFGSVGRALSPDALDNEALWLAHVVVAPEFRNRGIFKTIYKHQLSYATSQAGRVLSCTDNPIVAEFYLKNGWKKIRETVDEAGGRSVVLEYGNPLKG